MIWDEERLLTTEVDVIHGLDPAADEPPFLLRKSTPRAVWAWSPRARLLAVAPEVGAGLREAALAEGADEAYRPGEPPAALVRLAASLGDRAATAPGTDGPEATGAGATTPAITGGPSFVFPAGVRVRAPDHSPLPVVVSDGEGREAARSWIRPDNWQPGEWEELIGGRAGEWAMAVDGREPVSICHSPATNADAAEAGVWTRADHRGRRLAPAAVAAWAGREARAKEVLFYSTSADNHASQSVARRLGLTPLGWIWAVR
ncbi:GNAT family N-acetyltransferase [Streptomyces sp. PTD5-9]|uniref:GNAT family N-acetyltransferase n=1 Tax=Streptomyces sp. PTD5-9 TaxID=3120150 RepID=UPI0030082149